MILLSSFSFLRALRQNSLVVPRQSQSYRKSSVQDKLLYFLSFAPSASFAVKMDFYSPALFAEAGFHLSIGFLAAAVSSSRFTRVVCGAFLTNSGSSSASR